MFSAGWSGEDEPAEWGGARPRNIRHSLQAYRRRAGLTQQEAARRAGLSVAALRDIEQGRVAAPRPETLRRLAVALGLSAGEQSELAAAGGAAQASGVREAGERESPVLWLGVLGPLTVRVAGAAVDLGSEVQRVLLGLLALSPNVPVARERLVARLAAARGATGEGPGAESLAARISRLRRRLRLAPDPAAPSLVARAGGYELVVADDQLDLLAFRAAVAHARRLRSSGDILTAWQRYSAAVRLWRGEPMAGLAALADDPAVVAVVRQWPSVVAEYAALGVELRRYEEVVPVLRRVVAADPLHESLHAQLMVALAGTGRQAEALEVFDALRRRLGRDLSAGPGAELMAAHRQVLRQAVVVRPAGEVVRARRTLPMDVADFTGREPELRWLWQRVPAANGGTPATGSAAVVAIEGMPGVGKSRLAIHFAHQLVAQGRCPHQQLYADLAHGALGPMAVLATFLRLLGVAGDELPVDQAGRIALYQDRLREEPALVLLDGAGDSGQVESLLPAGPGSLTVVTSRRPLGLATADHLVLQPFPERAALELLAAVIGADRVAAEPEPARQLVAGCGRLPLAISLLGRRLLARPAWTLAETASRVADPAGRLDELAAGGRSVREVFEQSYRALPAELRKAVRCLRDHPDAQLSVAAAADRLGAASSVARRTLDQLCREQLVFRTGGDRYGLHDLVRDYLREAA